MLRYLASFQQRTWALTTRRLFMRARASGEPEDGRPAPKRKPAVGGVVRPAPAATGSDLVSRSPAPSVSNQCQRAQGGDRQGRGLGCGIRNSEVLVQRRVGGITDRAHEFHSGQVVIVLVVSRTG